MQIITLYNWLTNCPYITGPITMECLGATPDAVGVFAKGTRELSRQQDVVGTVWVTYRSSFLLLRRVARRTDDSNLAQWLLDLQGWFLQKSVRKEFSHSLLSQVRVCASDGSLQKDTADGMGVYGVTLDVEYVKTYPAK